ncbi:hypothetical protein Slin15195_G109670 [Septoria linicola]|uniref:Uncharacterized protein n=1 Tax=Septoria linicola TaxID=215465 RepID=A0A9Q9EQK5_9PEZI|nr:hypothetical protein Slin14017_G108020 [Septoria linicola]USW57648.1 hypothetical protein Slin15195_G109670 [Septoria linicola]
MRLSTTTILSGLLALASAAPTRDHIRRDINDPGHKVEAPSRVYAAYPTGTAAIYPTGTGRPIVPTPTGTTSCPVDGAVVCNGPELFGLCNFGSVVFQPVAAGTACENGKIVGTGIYEMPTAAAV